MKASILTPVLALCLVLCTTSAVECSAANDPVESAKFTEATGLLDIWLESMVDFERLPGLAISVVHDQELVYAKGFGYADLETRTKATPETVFGICSISKMLTALAVGQLCDEGRLALDDPVSKHLPWFTPPGDSPTLRSLLRHTGGLPCEPDYTLWRELQDAYPPRDEFIARARVVKPSYPVDTQHNYSNLGYALLGEVVAQISASSYEQYVERHLLDPLGMDSTTCPARRNPRRDRLATGYGRWPRSGARPVVRDVEWRAMNPAGGYASTVLDLARLASWQFRVLDGKDDGILRRETLEEMQSVQWENPKWGLGFYQWWLGDDDLVGHLGGCSGYKSQIVLSLEKKLAVTVMINAKDADQFGLALRSFEIIATAFAAEEPARARSEDWSAYAGFYETDLTWSEAAVLQWDGAPAVMWLPTGDPVGSLTRLQRIDGEIFRHAGNNGWLGKHFIFERDASGEVIGMKFNNNVLWKTGR